MYVLGSGISWHVYYVILNATINCRTEFFSTLYFRQKTLAIIDFLGSYLQENHIHFSVWNTTSFIFKFFTFVERCQLFVTIVEFDF
jgi:hypothetical protein